MFSDENWSNSLHLYLRVFALPGIIGWQVYAIPLLYEPNYCSVSITYFCLHVPMSFSKINQFLSIVLGWMTWEIISHPHRCKLSRVYTCLKLHLDNHAEKLTSRHTVTFASSFMLSSCYLRELQRYVSSSLWTNPSACEPLQTSAFHNCYNNTLPPLVGPSSIENQRRSTSDAWSCLPARDQLDFGSFRLSKCVGGKANAVFVWFRCIGTNMMFPSFSQMHRYNFDSCKDLFSSLLMHVLLHLTMVYIISTLHQATANIPSLYRPSPSTSRPYDAGCHLSLRADNITKPFRQLSRHPSTPECVIHFAKVLENTWTMIQLPFKLQFFWS